MSYDIEAYAQTELRRLRYKLRSLLYEYYLWSVPMVAPAVDLAVLADNAMVEAERILAEYKAGKGQP